MNNLGRCCKFHWRGKLAVLFPLITLPIVIYGYTDNEPKYRCSYLVLNMAFFWITECIPLYLTSLMPIVFLPLFDILTSEKVCQLYLTDTLVVFIAGIFVALAVEYSNLHQRIALGTILLVGFSPRRLHLGLMGVTAFMSLWISNSAGTAMMCPIVKAVLNEMDAQKIFEVYKSQEEEPVAEGEPPHPSTISMGFYFGVAYAATIGGCGTLIGTGTNLTFKGIYDTRFPHSKEKVEFPIFMLYSMPLVVIVNVTLVYLTIQITHMGLFRKNSKVGREVKRAADNKQIVKEVVKERFKQLGPMTMHEIQVVIMFVLMILLLFSRKPGFVTGWNKLTSENEMGSSVAILVPCILLFALPTQYTFFRYCCKKEPPYTGHTMDSCISWMFLHTHTPWGLCFLLGGGFALAEGSKVSGMAKMLGDQLQFLSGMPTGLVPGIAIILSIFGTAFSSNVATANIFVPVFCETALAINMHPLLLTLPSTLAMSMAFHLPVSTPPNAIVCSYGNIKTKYLALAGIAPTIIGICLLWINAVSWGLFVYPQTKSFPAWAKEYKESGK